MNEQDIRRTNKIFADGITISIAIAVLAGMIGVFIPSMSWIAIYVFVVIFIGLCVLFAVLETEPKYTDDMP